jgi:Ca2+-binding RTX toxin-like protein
VASLNGTPTNDFLFSEFDEPDLIFGFEGNDTILGLGQNDTLVGGSGEDLISGSLGDDILFGNAEIDDLLGDEGNDSIAAGQGDDRVQGDRGDDLLFGNLGKDFLVGGPNNDTILGGKDDDLLFGGSGNDVLFGDLGMDFIQGVDTGQSGEVSQFGLGEIDTLTGGADRDFFVLGDETRSFYFGLGNNDFVVITDFQSGEDIFIVQTIDNIVLSNFSVASLGNGVGIFAKTETQDELIGFVQGLSVDRLKINVDLIGVK